MQPENRQIVILHIPKTAGTSLRKLVQRNYKKGECFFVYEKKSRFTTIEEFTNLEQEERKKLKIVMGHLPCNPLCYSGMEPIYVTIMRKPVERVISYYNHIMTRKDGWVSNNVSLMKYLDESGDQQVSNHQTRIISGLGGIPITDDHLRTALHNLETSFLFTGLSEEYSESVRRLAALLNWTDVTIYRENQSRVKSGINYYSKYEIQKILELNQYDMELYNFVRARFDTVAGVN